MLIFYNDPMCCGASRLACWDFGNPDDSAINYLKALKEQPNTPVPFPNGRIAPWYGLPDETKKEVGTYQNRLYGGLVDAILTDYQVEEWKDTLKEVGMTPTCVFRNPVHGSSLTHFVFQRGASAPDAMAKRREDFFGVPVRTL